MLFLSEGDRLRHSPDKNYDSRSDAALLKAEKMKMYGRANKLACRNDSLPQKYNFVFSLVILDGGVSSV